MKTCTLCGKKSPHISKELGICLDCIRCRPEEACAFASRTHERIRRAWGLPSLPPDDADGIACNICLNHCRIGDGQWGCCGLRTNIQGKLAGVSAKTGKLSWYHDPLPTNCVGDWVCPGGGECGYPDYSYKMGAEYGYDNLAVFTHACIFNCLYCQNWHFRHHTFDRAVTSIEDLAGAVRPNTACVCYFGGDPSPQMPFLLNASRVMQKTNKDRILRFCWETNGAMSPSLLADAADLSLASGGCIKFDLKAWDETLHMALTGVTNRQTLENFVRLAKYIPLRRDPPFLIASTLMVPGYIDAAEIEQIAGFIASLDPDIPYSLLAFYPEYKMTDLPATSRQEAQACAAAAKQAGLKRVKIGNQHLLR